MEIKKSPLSLSKKLVNTNKNRKYYEVDTSPTEVDTSPTEVDTSPTEKKKSA